MGAARPTIFVAIASYCDPILLWTLDDCLAKARHPEDLRFGICWQRDPAQELDLERGVGERFDRRREQARDRVPLSAARMTLAGGGE